MNALVNHFATYQAEVGDTDPSLFIEQVEYEQYMHELGEQKAKAAVDRHVKNGNEADTLYGKSLVNRFIPHVAACIEELMSNTVAWLFVPIGATGLRQARLIVSL